MNTRSELLLEQLRNKKTGQWVFVHNIDKRTLPYFSRNPERAKFTNGFRPVVGALVRRTLGYDVNQSFEGDVVDTSKLQDTVNVAQDTEEDFLSIFSSKAVHDANLPILLAYTPLSDGRESVGEVRIAEFINQLFKLSDDEQWRSFLTADNSNSLNLYEDLIVKHLQPLKPAKDSTDTFAFIETDTLARSFNHDLSNLMKNRTFFNSHFDTFFAFYYFTYSIKLIATIEKASDNVEPFKAYYALDSEHISQSRRAASRNSFRVLRQSAKNLLPDSDVLVYLNYLIGDNDQFLFLPEILSLDNTQLEKLKSELRALISGIEAMEGVDKLDPIPADAGLREWITYLRNLIIINHHDKAPISRFIKSLDEIADYDFTKSRGRLGKIFNMSDELEILLVGVIVGGHNMLIKDFFAELEKRGVFLDRSSRDALTEDLDSRNLLEKMSDSGDAQYVKSLL